MYMKKSKTVGKVEGSKEISWRHDPGLSRIAIVAVPPLGAPRHYMVSDPIHFKAGHSYEIENDLVTGYKWGEFNIIPETKIEK